MRIHDRASLHPCSSVVVDERPATTTNGAVLGADTLLVARGSSATKEYLMDKVGFLSSVVITLGTLFVAVLTRRSAKDQTAVRGFADLNKALQEQVDRQGARIESLEQSEAKWRRLVRKHEMWDDEVLDKLRTLSGGEALPESPPLDRY